MTPTPNKPAHDNPPSDEIKHILKSSKKIAIVGLSPKEERDSHRVAKYLLKKGYEIVPVNPGLKEILGEACFKTLKDIPFKVDLVDLFLNPERVPPVVNQAIEIGAPVLWMQIGVIHQEAARKAREAGLAVVMDRCTMREHKKLFGDTDS